MLQRRWKHTTRKDTAPKHQLKHPYACTKWISRKTHHYTPELEGIKGQARYCDRNTTFVGTNRAMAWEIRHRRCEGTSKNGEAPLKEKWSHFDLKSWVTSGTKRDPGFRIIWRIFESNWLSISSQFDTNILQLLGTLGQILVTPVNQLFRSKWLLFFLSVSLTTTQGSQLLYFLQCRILWPDVDSTRYMTFGVLQRNT